MSLGTILIIGLILTAAGIVCLTIAHGRYCASRIRNALRRSHR